MDSREGGLGLGRGHLWGHLDNLLPHSFNPVLNECKSSRLAWCSNEHYWGFLGCSDGFVGVFSRQVSLDGTITRAFTGRCGRAAGNRSVLVVVVGGWESRGSNGKGTHFLTLANTAGLFMEAESLPEASGCCQLSSWNTNVAAIWLCPPLSESVSNKLEKCMTLLYE